MDPFRENCLKQPWVRLSPGQVGSQIQQSQGFSGTFYQVLQAATSFLHTGWTLVRGLPEAGALNDHHLLPPDPCPSQDPGREGLVTPLGKHA